MKYLPIFCALIFSSAAESATRYVNPSQQSRDSGAGTATAPYKTISFAMNQLGSGDRLIIAPGTYRETLKFKGSAKDVIVEGSAGTMIKGSDVVTGWESQGGGVYVRRGWNTNSQQVFVNGVSMKQIGGKVASAYQWPGRVNGGLSSMTDNSFYLEGDKLYVKPAGGSLSGKTVEVSVRTYLAHGSNTSNVQLKNLAFSHSNTTATTRSAAISMHGNGTTIDNVTVTWCDGIGIKITGNTNTVRNSVANYCGQMGMGGVGSGNKWHNNETNYNNYRGFAINWAAAGAKFAGSSPILQDSEIIGHKALYNNGTGIWVDQGAKNVKIMNSVSAYNQRDGIHYEISSYGQIYNNIVFGNKERGIYLANSSNSLVAHNLAVQSGFENIRSSNGRDAAASSSWAPKNNKIIGNISAWGSNDILHLPEAQLTNTSNGNLFANNSTPVYAQENTNKATGLKNWQGISGQDKNSWEKVMAMSSTLSSALTARQATVDWSSLKSLASQNQSPPTPLDGGLPPGPLNGRW